MLSRTVDVSEAVKHLEEWLAWVRAGQEVILAKGDTPFARIVPITLQAQQRVAGLHARTIWTSDDFDAPLPDEFWSALIHSSHNMTFK